MIVDMPSAKPANLKDYDRVREALALIEARFPEPIGLEELAGAIGVSPFHFQRTFRRWAGISPKRFQQYLAIDRAKSALEKSESVLDAAFEAGLSGPGRLHDLFVSVESMTPGEYKLQARDLEIRYGYGASPFGECLVMATERGICGLGFVDGTNNEEARAASFKELSADWPEAHFVEDSRAAGKLLKEIFAEPGRRDQSLTLFLKGTNFQIKVWEALLRVPAGHVLSYQDLAVRIGHPTSARAVGGAVARNSIPWIIPCHRVIRKSGAFYRYRWGRVRKMAMLGLEAAELEAASQNAA
jgi:AraC family transcriptional regulator of adaptative response/methylated-DNA-[protein]-cysteine methyltransferase